MTNETASERLAVRVSPGEARDFAAAATVAGKSRSEALRIAMADFAESVTKFLDDGAGDESPGAVETPTDDLEGRPERGSE